MVMQNKLAIVPSKSCHTFNQGYLKYIFTFLLTPFLLWPYRLFTKCRLFDDASRTKKKLVLNNSTRR